MSKILCDYPFKVNMKCYLLLILLGKIELTQYFV